MQVTGKHSGEDVPSSVQHDGTYLYIPFMAESTFLGNRRCSVTVFAVNKCGESC